MKRVVLALLALLAVLLAPSLTWGDDSRHYEFRLAANGEATYHAAAGDTVTVSLTLCRTTGTGPMFAMQDEICFDPAFFAYQPDGTLLREGVKTTLVTLRDGRQAVYMNYVDFGGGADWADETVVGSFQLKVLADGGASAITGSHYLVSTEDGMGRYAAAARDITVVVSEQCRVTFQSNGGSGVAPAEVLRGTPLAPPQAPTRSGYRFTGWYSDYDPPLGFQCAGHGGYDIVCRLAASAGRRALRRSVGMAYCWCFHFGTDRFSPPPPQLDRKKAKQNRPSGRFYFALRGSGPFTDSAPRRAACKTGEKFGVSGGSRCNTVLRCYNKADMIGTEVQP